MKKLSIGLLAVAITAAWSTAALADPHWRGDDEHRWHGDGWHGRGDGLAGTVRDSTRRYRDLSLATSEGYALFLGCVSGMQEGAMGVHYANGTLVGDDVLDAKRPEGVLVYEPQRDGGLRLAAVEFLVLAEAWDASHAMPPVLEGQSFHYTGSPNRYGLPPFYALHVWAWKHNPHGTFVNWNPNVSCDNYAPETP